MVLPAVPSKKKKAKGKGQSRSNPTLVTNKPQPHVDDGHAFEACKDASNVNCDGGKSDDDKSSSAPQVAEGLPVPLSNQTTAAVTAVSNSFHAIAPPLSAGVLSALSSYEFSTMTPVQAAVIPLFLTNKDVCVQAVTGSGKTLAFLIPMVEMILRRTDLLKKKQIGGLVVSPTRELARQTFTVTADLCRHCSLSKPLLLVGGGSAYRPVATDLQTFSESGSDIVIGTPGRLDDILSRYDNIDTSELECLVLDEADVLLDMGFEITLTSLLKRLPKMRRTGLFSATKTNTGTSSNSSGVAGLKNLMARAGLRNPVVINVAVARSTHECLDTMKPSLIKSQEQATPSSLSNYYLVTPLDHKLSRLTAFLLQHRGEKIIVFFLTCASVEFYSAALQQVLPVRKFYLEPLHGKMMQKRREKAMERFRNGGLDDDETTSSVLKKGSEPKQSSGVLLCTDVAARGLDVSDVQWTVQFDPPSDPSQYVHRVGRSARAGKTGSSLLFLTPKEEAYVDFLRMRKVPLTEIPNSEFCAPPKDLDDHIDDESEGTKTLTTKRHSEENNEGGNEDTPMSRIIRNASNGMILDVLPKIRNMVLQDRDLLEKGTKAFTSYIRAYKEHHCSFIFRFADLDLGLLASSFCLLRLPKMPELRDKIGKLNFAPAGPEIDIYAIAFKDKVREKARQKRLASELAAGGKNAKTIKAEQRTAERIQRQKDRREAEIAKGRNPNKKRGKQAQMFDEWDELAKEERLHKKLKMGKINKQQYKDLMYGNQPLDEDAMFDNDQV